MGVQFSAGMFLPQVSFLTQADLLRLESRIRRCRIDPSITLLTKKDIQTILQLNDMQTYIIFRLFDVNSQNRVPALDLFGAIALAAADDIENKLRFIFNLIDQNRDNHINEVEANIICLSACRGFTRLKQLQSPSAGVIERIIRDVFHQDEDDVDRQRVHLNEDGEISFAHLKAFLLFHEACRMYFANLGTKHVTRDVSKLLEQRAELLREMAVVKADMKLLADTLADAAEDSATYYSERGGDIKHLQLPSDMASLTELDALDTYVDPYVNPSVPTEAQRLRRHARVKLLKKPVEDGAVDVVDAVIFANGCRNKDAIGGHSSFESAFRKKWSSFRDNNKEPVDGALRLDVDLLEDLFESIGVSLSDADAAQCLAEIPRNHADMYTPTDILRWFHAFSRDKQIFYPRWCVELEALRRFYSKSLAAYALAMDTLTHQRALIGPSDAVYLVYNKYINAFAEQSPVAVSEAARVLQCASHSSVHINWSINEEDDVVVPPASSRGNTTPGASRKPTPATQAKKGSTNKFVGGKPAPKVVSGAQAIPEDEAAQRKAKYHGYIHLRLSCVAAGVGTASSLCNESRRLVVELSRMSADDVLRHFNAKKFTKSTLHASQIELDKYKSVIWLPLKLSAAATEAEAEVVRQTAANFFSSILWSYREALYSDVEAEVFLAHPSDADLADMDQKVVLIALLQTQDVWRRFEQELPVDILVSRVIRSMEVSLCCRSSLHELYLESKEYEHYLSRCYGPQEDEIGEEGMNPLRFAKACRQNKKSLEDKLGRIEATSIDAMKEELESAGYATQGSKSELLQRYQALLQRQLAAIGFGELSLFGKRVCSELFRRYDADQDHSLSVHEMNALLSDIGQSTIYDAQEYRKINAQAGFQVNAQGNLTLKGFIAYFEAGGHLVDTMEILGVGSLDDLVRGTLLARIDLIDGALSSLYSICEEQTYAQTLLKTLLLVLSNLKDFQLNLYWQKLSEIWNNESLRSPGWLARCFYAIEAYLADGDHGFIRMLRQSAYDLFSKYDVFDEAFVQLCKDIPTGTNKAARAELLAVQAKLEGLLPPLIDSRTLEEELAKLDRSIAALKAHLVDCEAHLQSEVKSNITKYEKDIDDLVRTKEKAIQLMGCHGNAFYDAIRLYVKTFVGVGAGTAEMSLELDTHGLEWVRYLPRGMGEPCSLKLAREEKITRANRRKEEALAALERERARRDISEEEKDRLRRLKVEGIQRERDEEEKRLFDTAYLSLVEYREGIANMTRDDYLKVLAHWRQLCALKENRYPYTLKSAIAHIDTAIIVLELEIQEEAAAQNEAKLLARKALQEIMHELLVTYPIKSIISSMDFDQGFRHIEFPKHMAACYLLLLQDCVTVLRYVGDMNTLSQSNDAIVTIGFLEELLGDKERVNMNAERKLPDISMTLLPMGDVVEAMRETLLEFNQVKELELKRREIELLMRLEAARKLAAEQHEETPEEKARRLRLEKEYAKQKRREDRIALVNARNKLYGMIQTDEVSQLFRSKAKIIAEDFGVVLPDVKDPFEAPVT